MYSEIKEDLREVRTGLRTLLIETIVFTVLLSVFIVGATLNTVKQLNDFNAELDAKMAQIEAQMERTINR